MKMTIDLGATLTSPGMGLTELVLDSGRCVKLKRGRS